MYTAFVFDLDGTLLDTLEDLQDAVNAALAAYGFPLRSIDEVRAFIGNGIVNLMKRAIGRTDYPDFAGVMQAFKEHYKVHCADKTKPYDKVLDLLQELRARGVKTAVLSNKADFAVKQLAKTYFDGLLDEAVGENEEAGVRKKPAPDALFTVMEALGVKREETVYIGDSEVDIQTAKNAGVDCVCVTWGFRDKAFLQEQGGEIFVGTPQEILSFVGKDGVIK